MASLVIKNLPGKIHASLKARAKGHRRSMTQEAIAALEGYCLMAADTAAPYGAAERSRTAMARRPMSSRGVKKAKHGGADDVFFKALARLKKLREQQKPWKGKSIVEMIREDRDR